jgi:hypothetical protein
VQNWLLTRLVSESRMLGILSPCLLYTFM